MKRTEYTTEFVHTIPEKLDDGVLYMAPHYHCSLHKCMCGCGEVVSTPLNAVKGDNYGWNWSYNGVNASLTPSVGNYHQPCKSHYFLTHGKVQWC